MKRKKHINDTKANIHWDRWERSKNFFGRFAHSDWIIEGKLKRRKKREKDFYRETVIK